jgi:hypothetical protein
MNNSFASLITSDAKAGLALAGNLADQLQAVIEPGGSKVELPGGTYFVASGLAEPKFQPRLESPVCNKPFESPSPSTPQTHVTMLESD